MKINWDALIGSIIVYFGAEMFWLEILNSKVVAHIVSAIMTVLTYWFIKEIKFRYRQKEHRQQVKNKLKYKKGMKNEKVSK